MKNIAFLLNSSYFTQNLFCFYYLSEHDRVTREKNIEIIYSILVDYIFPDRRLILKSLAPLTAEDWSSLFSKSSNLGLAPIVGKHLKSCKSHLNIPSEIILKFANAIISNAAWITILENQLMEVQKIADKSEIELIVLKGISSSQHLYDDMSLRTMSDIDLLVDSKDIELIKRKIENSGYTADANNQFYWEQQVHLKFYPVKRGASIELHYIPGKNFIHAIEDISNIFVNRDKFLLGDVKIAKLGLKEELLYMCYHSFKHRGGRFAVRDSLDIALFIGKYHTRLDWRGLYNQALIWQIEKHLIYTISLAKKFIDKDIFKNILSHFDKDILDKEMMDWYFRRMSGSMNGSEQILLAFADIDKQKSFFKRLTKILYLTVNKKAVADYYQVDVDSWKLYLYYPRRFGSLLKEYGWIFLLYIFGCPKVKSKIGKFRDTFD